MENIITTEQLKREYADALLQDAKNIKNDTNIFNLLKGLSLLAILTFVLYFSISFITSIAKDALAVNHTMTKSSTHLPTVITKDTFKDSSMLEIKFMNKNNLTCLNTFVYNKPSNVKCFMKYNS